jgi:hypothetical protein
VRLVILAVALAVIARAHVTLLPGWVVPLPSLIFAAALAGCAVFIAWLVSQARHPLPAAAPESAAAPAGGGS